MILKDIQTKFDNTNNIEMDHLEPSTISEEFKNFYFEPKDRAVSREEYIYNLGNFLLLKKSNLPLEKGISYFEQMGLNNHWLINEIKEILNKHNIIIQDNKVPTEGFFTERKEQLKKYFLEIIEKYDNY